MQVQNCMERQRETNLKETKGTVETVETGDTCKYKIKRSRDQRRLKSLLRLERPVEIHKFYGEIERETKGD